MVNMSQRIIVTGGCGFIGATLSSRLVSEGYEVFSIDIMDKTRIEFDDGWTKLVCDIRDPMLEELIRRVKPDGIVHLAAVSRVIWGEQNPSSCWDVNVGGTRNLLRSLDAAGVSPWIIFGSSREVYGECGQTPVAEDHPKNPKNIYGESKLEAERMLEQYSRATGPNSVILRFSNVYGNGLDIMDRVIPRFINSALRGHPIEVHGGNQIFDFTHIDDTIEGIAKAIGQLEQTQSSGVRGLSRSYHILTGVGTSLQDLIGIIQPHVGFPIETKRTRSRCYDVDCFVGNPTRAAQELGFRGSILPDEGIRRTIELYRRLQVE